MPLHNGDQIRLFAFSKCCNRRNVLFFIYICSMSPYFYAYIGQLNLAVFLSFVYSVTQEQFPIQFFETLISADCGITIFGTKLDKILARIVPSCPVREDHNYSLTLLRFLNQVFSQLRLIFLDKHVLACTVVLAHQIATCLYQKTARCSSLSTTECVSLSTIAGLWLVDSWLLTNI